MEIPRVSHKIEYRPAIFPLRTISASHFGFFRNNYCVCAYRLPFAFGRLVLEVTVLLMWSSWSLEATLTVLRQATNSSMDSWEAPSSPRMMLFNLSSRLPFCPVASQTAVGGISHSSPMICASLTARVARRVAEHQD